MSLACSVIILEVIYKDGTIEPHHPLGMSHRITLEDAKYAALSYIEQNAYRYGKVWKLENGHMDLSRWQIRYYGIEGRKRAAKKLKQEDYLHLEKHD